ncbi:helix-turn-helix domain-containing protein [Dokdonella sp.]|uniref:helix-turn-helix domain-containing protein n=1 Tax=Dokdonella sp. TaxID=2291710 RepID=UPI003C69EC6B
MRPLDAVGISLEEEGAYRLLLAHPMATAEELSRHLGLALHRGQRLIDTLELRGLATHSPDRPRRYIPAAPEFALEALIRERQESLDRVRLSIAELKEHAARSSAASSPPNMIEVVTDPGAVRQLLMHLKESTLEDVVFLQRTPRMFVDPEPSSDPSVRQPPRPLRSRTISDIEFMGLPGEVRRIRNDIAAGDEARVYPVLPFKLLIADRRIAILPLSLQKPDGPHLLVRPSTLLDALYELFERLWERSTPIDFDRAGQIKRSPPPNRLPEAAEPLIQLMATGLNDKSIAHQLEISSATLNRRVAELMKAFDTRTRFQLGWRAALEAFPQRSATHKKTPRVR